MASLAPWRGGVSWWVVLLQGIVALAVGAYILTQPEVVGQWLVIGVAAYLLVTSALDVYAGMSGARPDGAHPFKLLSGGAGLVTALIVFVIPLFVSVNALTLLAILGIGFLGTGLIGLLGALSAREASGVRWGVALANALRLAFGGLLLYLASVGAAGDVLRWLGILAVVGGGALVVYALVLRRRPAAAA